MIHSSACSELRDGPYFALNHSYSALLPRTRVPTRATAASACTATRIQLLSCPRVFGWVDSIDRSHSRPRTFSDLARLYPRGRRRQECDQAHEKRRLDLEKRRSVKVNANAKPARRKASRRSASASQSRSVDAADTSTTSRGGEPCRGKCTVNVEPLPSPSLSSVTVPPCNSMIWWTIASPRPRPPICGVDFSLTC